MYKLSDNECHGVFLFMEVLCWSLNIYCLLYREKPYSVILEGMADSSHGVLPLYRVFSSSLDPSKTWYVLNAALCSCKPSNFCSSSSAKLFSDEYQFVDLSNLCGDGGVPASYLWFSSFRRTEKVHVSTAFGLLLGILRQRTLEDCPFIRSDYFKALMSSINSFEFNHEDRSESADEIRLKSHVAAIEAQLSSAAKEILTLRSQLRSGQSQCSTHLRILHRFRHALLSRQKFKARQI